MNQRMAGLSQEAFKHLQHDLFVGGVIFQNRISKIGLIFTSFPMLINFWQDSQCTCTCTFLF